MRRPTHRQDGTATVEAVIMLPVFILMLFGVGYVARLFDHVMSANDLARFCVQRYALMACENEDSLPSECHGMFQKPGDATDDDSEEAVALREARVHDGVSDTEKNSSVLTDVLDGLFGAGMLATVSDSVQRPPIVGAGETNIAATAYALCNTKPANSRDLAATLFDALSPDKKE